jgi:5-methylcytosine-specific restriction endonuclease McrA
VSLDRAKLRAMFGGKCAYCGRLLGNHFHADHINPKYRGGKDDIENLFPSCARCNIRKSIFTVEEFRHEIAEQVNRLRRNSNQYQLAEHFGQVKETGQDVVFWFEKHEAKTC